MKKFTIALLIVAVLLVSGCASQPGSSPGTQTAAQQTPQEPVKTLGQQTQTRGEGYIGTADSIYISLKQFSGKADSIATSKYPDACLISVISRSVASVQGGKGDDWSYKYYSKLQNKALTVEVQTKQTASGVDIYEKTTDNVVVFRDEPYKKCVSLMNDVDSTDAARAVAGLSGPVTISLENDAELLRDEYEFATNTKSIRVNAVTGVTLV